MSNRTNSTICLSSNKTIKVFLKQKQIALSSNTIFFAKPTLYEDFFLKSMQEIIFKFEAFMLKLIVKIPNLILGNFVSFGNNYIQISVCQVNVIY